MSQNNLCKVCGRFFEAEVASEYCPPCKAIDDQYYESVRNYLSQRPRASIFEVTTELKIPVKTIKRFLREDRLEIVEANNGFLKCDVCNIPIQSGYLCKSCKHGKFGNKYNNAPETNKSAEESSSLSITNKDSIKFL